jgi:hypothetical protein
MYLTYRKHPYELAHLLLLPIIHFCSSPFLLSILSYTQGEIQLSYIDGKPMKYFPRSSYKGRITLATSAITFMAMCIVGVIAAIYTIRRVLYKDIGTQAQTVASFLNAALVCNTLYCM